MSAHNPELPPPQHLPPNAAIQPDAADFTETPDLIPDTHQYERLPVWLYVLCGFFLFFAGSSFTGFSTFGSGLCDQGPGGPAVASASAQTEAPLSPIELGKKVYNGNCANCHQASGEGQPGVYPPMGGSEWVVGDKTRLTAIMLHGIVGPLSVRGGNYGTAAMPGWDSALTDDKIANLLTYIRSSWGNKADAVTSDEVGASRDKFSKQTNPWCEADLLKIAPHPAK